MLHFHSFVFCSGNDFDFVIAKHPSCFNLGFLKCLKNLAFCCLPPNHCFDAWDVTKTRRRQALLHPWLRTVTTGSFASESSQSSRRGAVQRVQPVQPNSGGERVGFEVGQHNQLESIGKSDIFYSSEFECIWRWIYWLMIFFLIVSWCVYTCRWLHVKLKTLSVERIWLLDSLLIQVLLCHKELSLQHLSEGARFFWGFVVYMAQMDLA